jgi:cytochrome o ubiquinol oxidase subunit II
MRNAYLCGGLAIAAVLGIVATIVYLHGVNIPVLEPAGPIALQERSIIIITVLLCAIVVIPVFVLLFFFAWKYRANSPETHIHHRPEWDHASIAVEFAWWLIPTAIIAVLSVILWQSAHTLDPYKPLPGPTPLTVDVVALDWKWLFIYPSQGIASVNLLEIPTNVPVTFEITADAPMNSFWIPQLGGQIMAMPGMVTELNLEASRNGSYNGFSANVSGDGFAGMAFTTKSVSGSDFNAWVQSVQDSSSTPLTSTAYEALAKPSEYAPISFYSSVDPSLYENIVMSYIVPNNSITTPPTDVPPTTVPPSTSNPPQGTMGGMQGMPMQMP